MSISLVIVESPAKAKTIEKYLGQGFRVEASVGHIRDLPSKKSQVPAKWREAYSDPVGVNIGSNYEPLYIVPSDKKAQVKKLKEALAEAGTLYLATDEDREGESISWHLAEVLKPKVPVLRLVFHEITQKAISGALANPREVNLNLVRAQETRRVVDRIFGYQVSPLLWRKLGRNTLSAGRVQSVALRLVVERERSRVGFVRASWWDLLGQFSCEGGEMEANLIRWDGQRPANSKDFGPDGLLKNKKGIFVLTEQDANVVREEVLRSNASVGGVDRKPYTDKPKPPFTTSTLQQEANRKFRWTARRTMRTAQRLYETGWITYMRTDSTTLSDEAIEAARGLIKDDYGAAFLPDTKRVYTKKAKGAQEAHEAIRPSGEKFRSISEAAKQVGPDEAKLYELIWKRTVACQMKNATGKYISLNVVAGKAEFVAKGKTIEFAGYRRAYVEGADNPEAELADSERILPDVSKGDALTLDELTVRGHETEPPRRLTEATLVKELEARGVGRPSTYASIIDRILHQYVFKKGSALVPTFTAFAVINLLEKSFPKLIEYDFTAKMESQLDEIAVGQDEYESFLRRFYDGDAGLRDQIVTAFEDIDPRDICSFPLGSTEDGVEVEIRVGRFGQFVAAEDVRAEFPDDIPPDELTMDIALEYLRKKKEGPKVLGVHPDSGDTLYLIEGRFGPYVQLGENPEVEKGKKKPPKPKRSSLLKGMALEDVDCDTAVALLSLPRTLGVHPENGEPVVAANGRFGPYLKNGKETRSLPADVGVLTVDLAKAVEILKQPSKKRGGKEVLKVMGVDASTEREIKLFSGRYGPYVADGNTNASLPKGTEVESLTLEAAIELIRKKELAPKRPRRRSKKK